MKKVDIDGKTRALNEFRMKAGNKAFTHEELKTALGNILSKNNTVISAILKCFPSAVVEGRKRMYEMPKVPIHKSIIIEAYNKQTKTQSKYYHKMKDSSDNVPTSGDKTQDAWNTLIEAGVIKTKFNINLLKSKYPKIYLECIEYELVK